MLSLTLTRTSLSLANLTITSDPANGFWLPEGGLSLPGRTWRREVATDNGVTHGEVLMGATLAPGSIPASIYIGGNTRVELRNRLVELFDALAQFTYTATVTEDGQADAYRADPADISEGVRDSGMSYALMERREITIPVYPIAGVA